MVIKREIPINGHLNGKLIVLKVVFFHKGKLSIAIFDHRRLYIESLSIYTIFLGNVKMEHIKPATSSLYRSRTLYKSAANHNLSVVSAYILMVWWLKTLLHDEPIINQPSVIYAYK